MNANIQKTCDLILENRNTLKSSMFWETGSNNYAIMAAMITASKGVRADAAAYKSCKKLLRRNISAFSEIRGLAQAAIVTKMTMVDQPEAYIQGIQAVYKKLRSLHKLTASSSMVIAAMNIYEHTGVQNADQDIEKLEELYKSLKKQHPLLITDDDRAYLSMLITSGLNVQQAVENIEDTFEACRKIALSKDAVHTLSQILALSPRDPQTKCEFVKSMIRSLKDSGNRINKNYALPAVAALALLNIPQDQLVTDVAEAADYLKGQKGFRWFEENKSFRVIYAMLAVFMSYSDSAEYIGAAIGTNITMVLAEEIIMMIILMDVMITTSMSSSSSSN